MGSELMCPVGAMYDHKAGVMLNKKQHKNVCAHLAQAQSVTTGAGDD